MLLIIQLGLHEHHVFTYVVVEVLRTTTIAFDEAHWTNMYRFCHVSLFALARSEGGCLLQQRVRQRVNTMACACHFKWLFRKLWGGLVASLSAMLCITLIFG